MIKTSNKRLSSSNNICYFDCFSGISGDMILGALVDAGVPLQKLEKELSRLPLKGYRLEARKVKRSGFSATKVDVIIKNIEQRSQNTDARQWEDIEKIIKTSTFSVNIKKEGLSIFKRLFQAEAKVHGGSFQKVHLHEVGAVDCIIDIFGALVGLDILGIKEVYSSPLNVGSGSVKTAHGLLPVPAPATVELLRGTPLYSSGIQHELTTPTGAVIVSTLARGFTPFPDMEVAAIGIGAGGKNFRTQPNVLRLFVGTGIRDAALKSEEGVTVIETNIDDMNPQVYEYVMERLFKSGALDVFLTNIIMKKGRPGVKLTVLSNEDDKDKLAKIILTETTSIGVRFHIAGRQVLEREIKTVKTRFGDIDLKLSSLEGKVLKAIPEYEDCKKIARKYNIPLLDVIREIGVIKIKGSRIQGV